MTLEVAGIALKVDSTDAVSAQANLAKMAQAGDGAAAAFGRVESTAKTAGAALAGTAAGASAGARGTVASATAAKSATDALKSTAEASKLTGHQTAQLSAQLQDLFVQIQAGGSPLTALLQQGSQLSAVFGGAVPAARALVGVVATSAGALTALGAVALGVGAAFLTGREQELAFRRALIQSGNAAGTTSGQLAQMAATINDLGGGTVSRASEALIEMALSGQIAADNLQRFTLAAVRMERAGGQSVTETAKAFADLGREPLTAALKLNESTGLLTASVIKQIAALQDQGRQTDAARVAQEALANSLEQRAPQMLETLGLLERGWKGIKDAIGEAASRIQGIGRQESSAQLASQLSQGIQDIEAGKLGEAAKKDLPALYEQLKVLRQGAGYEALSAAYEGERQANAKLFGQWTAQGALLLDRQARAEHEINEARRDGEQLVRAGIITQEQAAARLAAIRAKNDGGERRAALALEIATIKATEDQRISIYRSSESIVDALRQAGQLGDADYYSAKRAFVELDAAAQERAAQAEIERLRAYRGNATERLEILRQIAQAEARLAEVKSGAAAKTLLLNTQQKSAADALEQSYSTLKLTAAAALRATERTANNRAAEVGMSDKERERYAELEAVAARYTQRQVQLETEFISGRLRDKKDQYRQELTQLIESEGRELAIIEAGYAKRDAAQAKWENGAARAFKNYAAEAADVSGQMQQALTGAFKGAEDALVQFVTTGKLNFSQFAQSVISDLARIFVRTQITAPLAQALFGKGGAGLGLLAGIFGGGRADGGPVSAGRLYEVNETGAPELLNIGSRQMLMMGSQSGYVTPASGAAGSGGAAIVQHITIQSGVNANEVMAAMRRVKSETVAAVLDAQRRRYGGVAA